MKDKRVPSELMASMLTNLEHQGVIMTWAGPNLSSNGRRRWFVTYADGTEDNMSSGQCWAFLRGAEAATRALIGA